MFAADAVRCAQRDGTQEPPSDDIFVGVINGYSLYVAKADKRTTGKQYQQLAFDLPLPNITTGSDPNNGEYNTDVIIANDTPANAVAAHYCNDMGYSMPTVDELQFIYANAAAIDAQDDSGGLLTIAYISSRTDFSRFCSASTEYGATYNRWVNFASGSSTYSYKYDVRPTLIPVRIEA
jgi:hypothetical protein